MRATYGLLVVLLAASTARASSGAIDVDVGVGPEALFVSGPVFRDQPIHFGLKISVEAVISQQLLRENRGRLPPKYRSLVEHTDEARISPSIFIPDALIISPKIDHTGIFGISWKPLAAGIPLTHGTFSSGLNAGVVLTTFYLYSDTLPSTLFLRPGVELKAEGLLMFSRSFGFSVGWASAFYIPQEVGTFFGVGPFNQDIWHIGQAFLKVHVVFPYSVEF